VILFSLKSYFLKSKKKWLLTFLVMITISIVLKYNTGVFLPKGKDLLVWDYIFFSFSEPIVFLLLAPFMFTYLIGDIFTYDLKYRYLELIMVRANKRFQYFVSKVLIIFISSNLFSLCFLMSLFTCSFIFKMQLEGNYYYDVTIISLEISNSIVHTLIIQYILFAMFLTALGTFILAISILFKSSVYGFIGLAIFLQNGHNAIFNNNNAMFYSPFAQAPLYYHSPFFSYLSSDNTSTLSKYFTISYSLSYLYGMFLIFFLVGCIRFRKMNISSKGW